MFNLEASITNWRRQMLAAGVKAPVPLEELENHLRENLREHIQAGSSAAEAFNRSVQQLGQPNRIQHEFTKVERKFMKSMIKISAGVIGLLAGLAFVMPALAQCLHEGRMTNDEVVLYTLGMALCAGSAWVAGSALKKRKAC